MKKAILIIITLAFGSCIIDGHQDVHTKLINHSGHLINFEIFHNGTKLNIPIAINDTAIVNESRGMGDNVLRGNYGYLLQNYDSVRVWYDGINVIKHLKSDELNQKGIPYLSSRNLLNPDNYQEVITHQTAHSVTGYYAYTFTEQDYIDAKQ